MDRRRFQSNLCACGESKAAVPGDSNATVPICHCSAVTHWHVIAHPSPIGTRRSRRPSARPASRVPWSHPGTRRARGSPPVIRGLPRVRGGTRTGRRRRRRRAGGDDGRGRRRAAQPRRTGRPPGYPRPPRTARGDPVAHRHARRPSARGDPDDAARRLLRPTRCTMQCHDQCRVSRHIPSHARATGKERLRDCGSRWWARRAARRRAALPWHAAGM